jgi:hypothetical protein
VIEAACPREGPAVLHLAADLRHPDRKTGRGDVEFTADPFGVMWPLYV